MLDEDEDSQVDHFDSTLPACGSSNQMLDKSGPKTISGESVVNQGTIASNIRNSEINESTIVHDASSCQDTSVQEEVSPPTKLAHSMAPRPDPSPTSEFPMGTDPSPETEGPSLGPSNDRDEVQIPSQVQIGGAGISAEIGDDRISLAMNSCAS